MATVYFLLYFFWALPNSIAITKSPMKKEDWIEVFGICAISSVLSSFLALLLAHASQSYVPM